MQIRPFVHTSLFAALALGFLPQISYADDVPQASSGQWGLGLGGGASRPAYKGADTKGFGLPIITYDSERFHFAGTTADWKFAGTNQLSFSLRTRYALGDGYDEDDADILDGMKKRKAGIWLGGAVNWKTSLATVSLEVLKDVSASKGLQANLGIERNFTAGRFVFTPRAAVLWGNSKYQDYYFGVTSAEATPRRAQYNADATTNFQLGLRTTYLFNKHHSMFVDVGATFLGKEIKDSPLVERSVIPGVVAGYMYRF
ncbi:MipA/OmpV family protein [Achromobacter seleniivolatilans]|uniref:MipA/OmpV family protein n=1 Tax=Achromobacter seleniivolatilans TaxID=3047478 RepID=A0ABY9M617_9BURK|nr:MipA/OmpV family protein [Achromobacter sp. R39]WMD22152.1 MipA/OmpV family protein [Achromobacter sp. R39]